MPRAVVFHLGDRKTGSTAIQQALRGGAWRGAVPSVGFPARLHHARLANAFAPDAPPKAGLRELLALADKLWQMPEEIAVISSENFEGADPARLRDAIAAVLAPRVPDIRLIAYIRPHAERVVSSWAERVKLGMFRRPIEAYVARTGRNGRFRYHDRLSRWRAAFGPGFSVRPMIRAELRDGDVVRDFLSFLFRSEAFELAAPVRTNESLTLRQLAVLLALHRAFDRLPEPPDADLRAAVGRNLALRLAALPAVGPGGVKPALPRALVPEIQACYAEDAARVDADFLDGDPLSRALAAAGEKAADGPQPLRLIDHFPGPAAQQIDALLAFVAEVSAVAPKRLRAHFIARRIAAGLDPDADEGEDAIPDAPEAAPRAPAAGAAARRRAVGSPQAR